MSLTVCLLALALTACGGGGGATAAGGESTIAKPSASTGTAGGSGSATGNPVAPAEPVGTPAAGDAAATSLSFSFDLPAERSTSAGVYDGQGRLLRTLWRGERLPAGRHARSWDLRLDDGQAAPSGEVTVKVVHHDVKYVWQGVVGNSTAQAGSWPLRSFQPPVGLAADGDRLHIALGYNEAQSAMTGLRTGDPQRVAPAVQHTDPFIGVGLVASDGHALYMAQTGGISKAGFVFARRLADNEPVTFSQGRPLCLNTWAGTQKCYPEQTYASVVAWRAEGEAMPTGLAVQRNGPLLAVAYAAEQQVRVFDKRSGAALAQFTVPLSAQGKNQLSLGDDGDLWLAGEGRVLRYTDVATAARLVTRLETAGPPLALAADPQDKDRVWVAEGGAAQQVRRYGRGGSADRVFGRSGGSQGRAEVAADRLCFAGPGGQEQAALAVDGEGQIWVTDTCNNRLLRLGGTGAATASVSWLPASYVSAVDSQRPSRVFANFLEFEVQPTLSAQGGLQWRLLRNWLPALPPALRDEHAANLHWGGFTAVHTLASGRTIAQLNAHGTPWLVELGADGSVQPLMAMQGANASRTAEVLQPNGDLHHAVDEGDTQRVMQRRLDGYTSAGQPRWAASATVLARLPRSSGAPHHRMGTFTGVTGPRWPVTESGLLVSFDPGVENSGFHLGAASVGGSAWAWQSSPSGPMDGRGSFQARASDTGIHYGGNVALVAGRSIVYGYHGEFYTDLGNGRVGQANQFMHFLDNGLFIGQFGRPSTQVDAKAAPTPGLSGNAFSPWLVRAEGSTWLYHNDESSWGGVHRWELQGADDVVEIRASGTRGGPIQLR